MSAVEDELDEAFQQGMDDALHMAIWGVLGKPFDADSLKKVGAWKEFSKWVQEQERWAAERYKVNKR